MPELPEVETVLRTLERQIQGRRIEEVEVIYRKTVTGDPEAFVQALKGQCFRRFLRRGKYLLFELDDLTLSVHLRMEGKFYIYTKLPEDRKHIHVVFTLDDGRKLCYHDVRKFGRMELLPKKKSYRKFRDLGPEPLSKGFNTAYCRKYFEGNSFQIKAVLLDQSFTAGIGNIYADEILFASRIHPKRSCASLTERQIRSIVRNTKKILRKAIAAGGTTIRSYTSSLGVTGLFQLELMCHGQDVCPVCKRPIRKIRAASRGTYYCEHCQKEENL